MSVEPLEPKAPIGKPTKITATDIIIETIVDNPQLFSGRWWSIAALRDELIHEYDLLRLQKTYGDMINATQAIIHSITTCGWMELDGGAGLDCKFKVRNMPLVKPDNVRDCYIVIDHYRDVMRNWKDVCLTLHDTSMVLRSMKMSTEQAQEMLNKSVALAVMYRNQAKVYYEQLKDKKLIKGEFHDPKPKDVMTVIEDPKHVMQVSELKELHSLLAHQENRNG
jgi:hypothetical protein